MVTDDPDVFMRVQDTLIRHATAPIEFDSKKLHREHLVDLIHENLHRKLIAIGAPAGYGKTTILADFAHHSTIPVCWMRLSIVERDVFRFVQVLAASLQRKFRRLQGSPDLGKLAGSSPEALAREFINCIEDLIPEPFAIAIDDVQYINNSKNVLRFLDAFIEELPEQVTVITAGREILNVALARLMAEGDLAGIGPHDLAFSRQELGDFVDGLSGVTLSDEELLELYEQTRGWVTGVVLSNHLASGGLQALFQSATGLVYEYLISVVLQQQPEFIRKFLLESSILPVMTYSSCDEVLSRDDSLKMLNLLLDKGLFISVTSDIPRTYEYHPQFRSFLSTYYLRNEPLAFKDHQLKAAAYLEESGAVEHAVNLYFESGDFRQAAYLAERNAQQMFYQGRYDTLRDWERLFSNTDEAVPYVNLYLSKVYTDQGDLGAARNFLLATESSSSDDVSSTIRANVENQKALIALKDSEYELAWQHAEAADEISRETKDLLNLASSLRVRAYSLLAQNINLVQAEEMARAAVNLLEKGTQQYDLALIYSDLAAIQLLSGKTVESQQSSAQAHRILLERGAPVPLAVSFNNMGYYAHMRGDFEHALQYYREGLKFSRRGSSSEREAIVLFGLADLFNDLGLSFQAGSYYDEGLQIATRLQSGYLISYGCLGTSVLHRRSKNGDLPHQWLQRAINLGSHKEIPERIRVQIGALEIASSPSSARSTLAAVIAMESGVDAVERTKSLFFYACALLAENQYLESVDYFSRAFDEAARNGMEQVLAAEILPDPVSADFLSRYLRSHPHYEVISQRIESLGAFSRQFALSDDSTNVEINHLKVNVLGKVELISANRYIDEIKPLDREILIYLLDRMRTEKDVLLELFWPDSLPGKKAASLYTAIYSLRRVLGKEVVLLDGSVYAVNPDQSLDFDVHRFERAAGIAEKLKHGEPRRYFALTEAVGLYSGEFFPEASSDWVLDRRRHLETRYLDLLLELSDEALIHDHAGRAAEAVRKALAIDPYRDDLNFRYLEALGRLERRSEIVAHYQQYVRLLSDDLGLDPPLSVSQLYARLLG